MAGPVVLSVDPENSQAGVVLGSPITVTFDQPIDPATVTNATFSLTGPGQNQILTPEQLIAQTPDVMSTRDIIPGAFSFAINNTQVIFTPTLSLAQTTSYTVLLLGADGLLSSSSIANPGAEKMAKSYQWTFITGDQNVTTPPQRSPLPANLPLLDPNTVKMRVNKLPVPGVGTDLSAEIDLIFPGPVDETSFSLDDLLMSLEPVVGDLSVTVPANLVTTARVDGNTIRITITGW